MRKPFLYNLPKGYLSYSAMTLWMKNKEGYRAKYYRQEPEFDTAPLRFGKLIADVLEKRDYKEYPELLKVPVYPISEQPFDVLIEDGLIVKARLDLFDPPAFRFGEVKTGHASPSGDAPWDAIKVLKHEQLPFYSLLIKIALGQVHPMTELVWLETRYKKSMEQIGSRLIESDGKDLELTGRIEIFPRRIAEWERARIKRMIIKSAREITLDYNEYIKTAVK